MTPRLRALWLIDWACLIGAYALPALGALNLFYPALITGSLSFSFLAFGDAIILCSMGICLFFMAGHFYHLKYDPPRSGVQ